MGSKKQSYPDRVTTTHFSDKRALLYRADSDPLGTQSGRLCVQRPTSQRSNIPLCSPLLFTSVPPHFLGSRSPYPPAPIEDPDPVGTTIALSPLAATLMDLHASVANKRLTSWLSPLDATLTKNGGWGQSRAIFHLTVQLSTVDCQPLPPCSSTDHRTRITTDDSLLVVSYG